MVVENVSDLSYTTSLTVSYFDCFLDPTCPPACSNTAALYVVRGRMFIRTVIMRFSHQGDLIGVGHKPGFSHWVGSGTNELISLKHKLTLH